MGGVWRGGGGGGSGWDTPPPRVSGKKLGKIFFFSAEDGNGTQKNENLWDIITSKRMPPVAFEPATCRPEVHCSTTHLSHRTAYPMHPKVHSMTCYPKKNSQKFSIGC